MFYIINLRISQRNQELSLKAQQQAAETRQAQLFMSPHDSSINVETLKIDFELMEWRWKDYDDSQSKYGSPNNLDATVKRHSLHYRLDNARTRGVCRCVNTPFNMRVFCVQNACISRANLLSVHGS